MLTANCDRCGKEILDWEAKKHQLMIVNSHEDRVQTFDLCDSCGPTINTQISDFIKGA